MPSWTLFFISYLVRKRFDQVCLLLQQKLAEGTQPHWYSPLQSLVTLFLAYPTHRQRAQHPHLVDLWAQEVRRLVKAEQGTGWPDQLWLILELLDGQSTDRAARFFRHWQEPFVANIVHSTVPVDPKSFHALALQSMELLGGQRSVFEDATLALLSGDLPGFFEHLRGLDWLYPHIADVFWKAGGIQQIFQEKATDVHSQAMINYGKTVCERVPSFWNLAADYYWASPTAEGRNQLESMLFNLAKHSKDADKRQAIIDLCLSFGMDLLADAIHIMIVEEMVAGGNLHLALIHAIQSRQSALITKVCDSIFEEHFKTPEASFEFVEDDVIDVSACPRLSLLAKYQLLLHLLASGKFDQAKIVFANQILEGPDFLIPEQWKPRLMALYKRLCESDPDDASFVTPSMVKLMLEFLNGAPSTLSQSDAHSLRLLLIRQSAKLFIAA
jgi:hypothetical protein